MDIVYMGNNERGIACLRTLNDSKHNILYAVAQKSSGGWYSSIEETARELNIPTSVENNPNDKQLLKKLRGLSPDLIVMCGYSKIVGKELREIPKNRCINLHASLLPYYRGAAPLNWALINGEDKIGLSIYFVDEGIDTGPIISQRIINVSLEDTIKDISQKAVEIYPSMLLQVCDDIENGSVNARKQNLNEGSYYTKRYPKDGQFNWTSMTDLNIYNLVRALTHPYPGAFFNYKGNKVFVWEAKLEEKEYHGIPGRIAARQKGGVIVIAKNRGLKLTKIQVEGEEEVDAINLFHKVGEDLV